MTSSQAHSLVVSGTLTLDTTERLGAMHADVPGGSALYAAVVASLLLPTRVVGTVGRDFPLDAQHVVGAVGRDFPLDAQRAIDMSAVEVLDGPTFRWHARYEPDGNQRVTVSRDPGVAAGRLPRVPAMPDVNYALLLASTDPRVQAHVLDACARASLVGLDSMSHWWTEHRDALRALMRRVDVVFVDEHELVLATDTTDVLDGVQRLLALGPQIVVVKRGSRGAFMQRGHHAPMAVNAASVPLVDATGAGDAFAGAFMAALVRAPERGDAYALRFATSVASFAVEGVGVSALATIDLDAVQARMADLRVENSRDMWTVNTSSRADQSH